ncbi:glycosyltransferase [Jiangella mangrovi]|uniref:Glycosyltransferase involved in cell wall biosynthesis n=1 Tax=Jiangella mangrovi TaxID=1524084 RepID=A0A7W9LLP7_9ACTN|nr:glycosyltransferase [Jiangella mangrovi]MBB5788440.1 glycosyltransferase involved in cell wall biosynthesis [Jiangella mangrovi]
MRVLVLTVVHDPEDARIRHRQIVALRDAGHEVTLAAPFTDYGRAIPPDLAVVDIPRSQGRHRFLAVRTARRLLKRHGRDYDIVLMHDPELVLATVGLDVPGLVWDVHEDTAAALRMKPWLPRFTRPAGAALIRAIERSAERRMPLLLAEESYAGRFRKEHTVVRNSVAIPDDVSVPVDDRVVYLGRLTAARGALDLVELGRRLAPEIQVHLVGPADADCAAVIEAAQADGAVVWHGFVPNDEALTMLPGALAGLSLLHEQPNYAHSRPTKIVEYMAHGLPVVSTPNPASAELIMRHRCGTVVPFGDVDAAEAAVRELQANPAERRRMTEAGRAAVIAHYSWDADADLFVHSLEKLAHATSR